MLFNSIQFLAFFVVVYTSYLAAGRSRVAQNVILLIASYVFYGFAGPAYVALLAFYTVVAFATGRLVEDPQQRWRRVVLGVAVASNLLVLAYFKYADFFIAQVNASLALSVPALHVLLPIGVSFFAFQSIAYMVDVYRGEVAAVRNLLDFAVFKAFFPQLVAGPIERARHMMPQFSAPRRITAASIRDGAYYVLLGYVLKCVVADRVASFVDYQFLVSIPAVDRTPEAALQAVVAFALQIYADFAGYTYIAMGLGRLMGIELTRNFRAPYLATDIQEFWRCWHITLSQWLRDYLYIPLGGSRHGEARTAVNLMITMALGGLWHGASWTFVIWGLWHGAALVGHRITRPVREALPMPVRIGGGWLLTQGVVLGGWAVFRARSFGDLQQLTSQIAHVDPSRLLALPLTWILVALCGVVAGIQYAEERPDQGAWVSRLSLEGRLAVYTAGLASVQAIGFGLHRFVYFQF